MIDKVKSVKHVLNFKLKMSLIKSKGSLKKRNENITNVTSCLCLKVLMSFSKSKQ